jgi:hypothetical protein
MYPVVRIATNVTAVMPSMICARKPGRARVRGISEIGVALSTLIPDDSTDGRKEANRHMGKNTVSEPLPARRQGLLQSPSHGDQARTRPD